jgi:hypothetical protein
MINFSVPDLLATITFVARVHQGTKEAQVVDRPLTADQRQELKRELDRLHKVCVGHRLERTEARVRRLRADLGNGQFLTARRLHIDSATLHQAIVDDLQERHFYHYPKDKGLLVLGVSTDWSGTLAAFPSSEHDIRAAVDCYALGHNHASVYHAMMVLEAGLPALAKRFKVKIKPNKSTWAPLIDDTRAAIDAELDNLAKPPKGTQPLSPNAATRKRAFLQACQEAALDLRHFKNVWRDHIAHGRADYDENGARKVLEHTRSFMENIASKAKLKEVKVT